MYRFSKFLILLIGFSLLFGCDKKSTEEESAYSYETVEGDPLNTRIYKLENGLTVYLSPFKDEPRIQTLIAVRAGSKYDPKETTGLAHYLEHMLFKGTHDMGTINWEKESALLKEISDLYEKHRTVEDPEEKKAIYARIDSLSYEASAFAVPNEYDKMISSMGAKSTNAFTSNDQTVYMNDIPSNELEKWLSIEGERFKTLVLRLFHTELETVYEEFNRSQDRDSRWSYQNVLTGLMPNHPYGTQTTIGEGEHLKNPSMVNIHDYFDKYYRPNNVAICLSGDLDPEKTIALIDQYFGGWQAADIPEFQNAEVPELKEPKTMETFGPEPEHIFLGYKLDGAKSRDVQLVKVMDMLLSNSQAGLIDLNLKQKQKVLDAYSFVNDMKDHTAHMLYARPREGQSLEEAKNLLLEQVELVKKGTFDDWLIEATIKNLKLYEMKQFESNMGRAFKMVDAFIYEKEWENTINELDELSKITKKEIIAFANENYGNNYVVSYKRKGEPKRHHVEKPKITPIQLNRDTQSAFYQNWEKLDAPRVEPVFLDYEKDIQQYNLASGVPINYIQNNLNETFSLNYIFDMGKEHDKKLSLAIEYLPYLGTSEYTAEDLKKEFYKLGVSFSVNTSDRKSYVTLSGLEESLEKGVELFEHILENVEPNAEIYAGLVSDILKNRQDDKDNKFRILYGGLASFAKYGPNSPFRDILSAEQLKSIDPSELTDMVHNLKNYEHRIFYFGQKTPEEVTKVLDQHHKVPESMMSYPEKTVYEVMEFDKAKTYFAHYDMTQAEVLMLSKDDVYNAELSAYASLFNEYFGSGLSSIVFQEIREQKALAYSAYGVFTSPSYQDEHHFVQAYVGTQADKMQKAIEEMTKILNDMPEAEKQFESAKDAAMKKIETDRITRSSIYWNYERAMDRGLEYDIREQVYEKLKTMTLADLKTFVNEHVSNKKFTIVVVGNKNSVDQKVLKALGDYRELSLEELFNY